MFSVAKVALFITASMAALVAATPVPGGASSGGSCNTGTIQCCNSEQSVDSFKSTGIAALLGINLEGVTGIVGSQCSPISILGGGSQCEASPMCCSNNEYNGLIVIGCTPINLGL